MNVYLKHADGNHKYTKKIWMNGKWHYFYGDENGHEVGEYKPEVKKSTTVEKRSPVAQPQEKSKGSGRGRGSSGKSSSDNEPEEKVAWTREWRNGHWVLKLNKVGYKKPNETIQPVLRKKRNQNKSTKTRLGE